MTENRIDVHQHVLPPFWAEGLRHFNSPHRPPIWSPGAAVDYMDSRGIAIGILSLTAPGLGAWPADERRDVARRVNEYTAGLSSTWPARFGNFATLPLPDMDGALEEAAYALDTLGADGIVLLSSYEDRYLGDPFFEPLWQELDRRAAIVFVHPTRTALPDLTGIPAAVVDFPFATTRTATDMVLKGVFDRHSRVQVILSHAGGFLPYAAHRFATCAKTLPGAPLIEPEASALFEGFRRFYYDTALSSNAPTIACLKGFADPSRIVFGSDFPYAPGHTAETYTETLDANASLSAAEHAAIASGNARVLLADGRHDFSHLGRENGGQP